jgi:hypothetical protein
MALARAFGESFRELVNVLVSVAAGAGLFMSSPRCFVLRTKAATVSGGRFKRRL